MGQKQEAEGKDGKLKAGTVLAACTAILPTVRRGFWPSVVVVAAAITAGVARADSTGTDTYPRQAAIDAIHYRFTVTLSAETDRIEAEAQVTVRAVSAVEHLELDFIGGSAGRGMQVKAVTRRGEPIAFTHADDRLRLPLPREVAAGEEVTYSITYGGVPANGLRVYTNMHGERVVFSEGWPNRARHWLPVIDHPSDKATSEMIVTAPADLQAVSNGVLVAEVDLGAGRRRTHWRQSVPLASWLFALGVARFNTHHAGTVQGVALQTWSFPQDATSARALFEETSRQALDFFSARIGPYPYEKLANVQASGFGGGMENASVIFYGEKGVASGRGPVVHEIAHQWFGNSVTARDWDDVWLSEGFATYFALLFREHFEGREAFVDGLTQSRATILEQTKKLPATPVIHPNLSDMSRVLNAFVYQKGGWVLHMLRQEIGSERFWRGIRDYYQRFRDKNASTDDFRQVMEQASGRDLKPFFDQWLRRGGVPRLEMQWSYNVAQRTVDVTVAQTQPGAPFRLRLKIAVETATGARIEEMPIERATETQSFSVTALPTRITLDPDTQLLAELLPVVRGQ